MIKGFFRILFKLMLVGLIFFFVALYVLQILVSKDDIRKEVENFLSQATGGKAVVSGDVNFTILPELSLGFSDANISESKNGFVEVNTIRNFKLKISLLKFLMATLDAELFININGKEYEADFYVSNLAVFGEGSSSDFAFNIGKPLVYNITAEASSDGNDVHIKDLVITSENTQGSGYFDRQVTINDNQYYSEVKGILEIKKLNIDEMEVFTPPAAIKVAAKNADLNTQAAENKANKKITSQQKDEDNQLWDDTKINVEWLSKVNMDMAIKIDKIVFKNSDIANMAINITIKDAVLNVDFKEMDIYGGKIGGTLNFSDMKPLEINTNFAVKDINIGNMLQDIWDINVVTGTLNVNSGGINTKGDNQKDMINSLAGNVEINLTDGEIANVGAAGLANKTLEMLYSIFDNSQQSNPVTKASATMQIDKGVINNQDLYIDMPLSPISGKGSLNLNNLWVKYRLKPTVVGVGNAGFKIPVLIKGDIRNPKIKLDKTSAIIDNIDQLQLLDNKQVDKIINKLVDKDLGGKLLKALQIK